MSLQFLFLIAIDAPGGFLFEWWSVFWDIFISRTNEKHSEAAAAYIEVILLCNTCILFLLVYGYVHLSSRGPHLVGTWCTRPLLVLYIWLVANLILCMYLHVGRPSKRRLENNFKCSKCN
jgi:hypothetical protein